jgi:hypothetical protein
MAAAAVCASHPEVNIWVEDFCLEAHSWRHQRVLLWYIDGQLEGPAFKWGLRGTLCQENHTQSNMVQMPLA